MLVVLDDCYEHPSFRNISNCKVQMKTTESWRLGNHGDQLQAEYSSVWVTRYLWTQCTGR